MVETAHQVEQFFAHLSLMELEKCHSLVSEMVDSVTAETEPEWWAIYLRGVLLNERDRDWSTSERLFRELAQKPLPRPLSIRVQNALANTYQYLGRWSDAIRYYHQLLDEQSGPEYGVERAKIWKNMAIAIETGFSNGVFTQRDLGLARGYCESALAALAEVRHLDSSEAWLESTVWNTYGLILRSLQEWPDALAALENFRALSDSLQDTYNAGAAMQSMGEVYERLGNLETAHEMYTAALITYRQFGDRYAESDVLTDLALLTYRQGKILESYDYVNQSIDLSESIRVRLTAPAAQMGYRSTVEKLYRTLISIHLAEDSWDKAFTAAERSRSRVLADLLLGQRLDSPIQVPNDLVTQRNALIQQITRFDSASGDAEQLANLEKDLSDIEHQIELFDPNYALIDSVQSLDTQAIQAALPQDAVLLSYTIDTDDLIWAMVVTPIEVIAHQIENTTAAWLRSFLSDHLDGVRQGALVPDKSGALSTPNLFPLLYRAFIEPVVGYLLPAQTIYIIPAGPLHYIPLGALVDQIGKEPKLLSKRRVIYAPSATILFNFCHRRKPSAETGTLLVAPTDDQLSLTVDFAKQMASGPKVSTLVDGAATCASLLEHASHHRLLCFLGHAIFDQHHPMSSRLKLVGGDLRASEIIRELHLDADLVILSACETGRNQILAGDELLGLTRALFYAGTPSILTTLWPVHEIPTMLLVDQILQRVAASDRGEREWDPASFLSEAQEWLNGLSYAAAQEHLQALFSAQGDNQDNRQDGNQMRNSLDAIWKMTQPSQPAQPHDRPFQHPFFWAPYILVGESLAKV